MNYSLFFSAFFCLLFYLSCNHPAPKSTHNIPNEHLNATSFEELVNILEDSSRQAWQKPDVVLKKMGELKGKVVTDIGAGTGYFSFRMAKLGAQVTAHDVDQRFLNYIQQNNNAIATKKVPKDNPVILKESVDIVLVVNTYHHIQDRVAYFNLVHHGLKSGGKLFIVDFKAQNTPHGPPKEMRINGLTVLKEIQRAGFSKTIIDVNSLPEQYIISAKK